MFIFKLRNYNKNMKISTLHNFIEILKILFKQKYKSDYIYIYIYNFR